MNQIKCSYCGKIGHTDVDCFKRQKEQQNANQSEQMELNKAEIKESKETTYVKPKPVSAKTISLASIKQNGQTLLQTKGTIDGNMELMVFDSGATSSVISQRLAKKYQIPVAEQVSRVTMADGSKKEVAMTQTVEI